MANYSVDPGMNFDGKKRVRRGPDLPPLSVQPSLADKLDAWRRGPMPGTQAANLEAGMAPAQAAAIRAQDIAPPSNVLGIPTAQVRGRNIGAPMDPAMAARFAALDAQAGAGVAQDMARDPANAPAGAPAATLPTVAPVHAVEQGGPALTDGVRRYNIGGDVGGANASRVYTTMGKDGVPIFTDNAAYAERNSGGGLSRNGPNGVNAAVMANSQGPNADRQFSASTLEQKGLRNRAFLDLKPEETAQALQIANNGANQRAGTDQALTDNMDANQLRAQQFAQQQATAGLNRSVASGPQTFKDQLALAKFEQDNTKAKTDAAAKATTDAASNTRQSAQDKKEAQQQAFTQYNALRKDHPEEAARFLAGRIKSGIAADKNFLNTPEGQYVGNTYAADVLQQGAVAGADTSDSNIFSLDKIFGSPKRSAIPTLGFGNIIQGKDNRFGGLALPSDEPGAENASFPAGESRLRRLIDRKPWGSSYTNFDPSVSLFTPEELAVMRQSGIRGG